MNVYYHPNVQNAVAVFIICNFVVQCTQRAIDPNQDKEIWETLVILFDIAWVMELLFHAYGYGLCIRVRDLNRFLKQKWNLFDIFVCSIGILDMMSFEFRGQIRCLRMLRVFRILRLFGRVDSLRTVLTALLYAMPAVLQSFVILVIMMCIYAVLACDLFRSALCDEEDEAILAYALTPRGKCFGKDYYGDYSASFYTMFQILTGDSWSENAVRPLLEIYAQRDDQVSKASVMLFFISFVLINSCVLLNVVVAAILDGMNQTDTERDTERDTEGVEATMKLADNILELLELEVAKRGAGDL